MEEVEPRRATCRTQEGTTPGKEEVELRPEQPPRATHDSMDGGGRTASATAVEDLRERPSMEVSGGVIECG